MNGAPTMGEWLLLCSIYWGPMIILVICEKISKIRLGLDSYDSEDNFW